LSRIAILLRARQLTKTLFLGVFNELLCFEYSDEGDQDSELIVISVPGLK